ncbi:helix-turn-helix transcriptional regulator [Roseiconus nitratireducens]|uniref:Helix-turn-helix transcriptional regulator n=1 Tax=Roseiconus nitratireducens TaxID=2605748 RepID=A0A5M6D0P0_9BACT|nr:helix-turn-helix transcriptional regulator [Roseiconus nitratireducens]KAA5538725.1 helix-turn-helix transcriptional regulator [Roseiconus nitratireducens]
MAKKKGKKSPTARRIDVTQYGIDLPAMIAEIRKDLDGMTHAEVGARAGMPAGAVSNYLNGSAKPSLGAVAALADAAGGHVTVRYDRPRKPPKGQ